MSLGMFMGILSASSSPLLIDMAWARYLRLALSIVLLVHMVTTDSAISSIVGAVLAMLSGTMSLLVSLVVDPCSVAVAGWFTCIVGSFDVSTTCCVSFSMGVAGRFCLTTVARTPSNTSMNF